MSDLLDSQENQALSKVEREQPTILQKLGLTAEQFAALDVDKMQRLLDFSLQVEAEQARRAFEAAFERAQARLAEIDIPKLTEGANSSRFAKTEVICRVLDPILVDEGFAWSFDDEDSSEAGQVKVVLVLTAGGHTERRSMLSPLWDGRGPKGGGVMTPLQAAGARNTYTERRLRMRVFGLHLVDDDTDGSSGGSTETITTDQAADLRATIQDVGANEQRLLQTYGVERLEELTVANLRGAHHALEQRRRMGKS